MNEFWKKFFVRLRSPAVWTSLFALILFIVKNWMGIRVEGIDKFVELLMGLMMAFGILNNPDSRDEF